MRTRQRHKCPESSLCSHPSLISCSEFSLENEVLKPFFLTGIFGCPTVRKFREFVAAIAGLLLFVVVCLSLSGVSFIYFLRQAFRVLFRERGIKAIFSRWDFWVPNRAKIPQICCGHCQPTVVCCCLFVFIWGFVHLFFATSMGIFLFCVVLCLGHCMHMRETLGRAWVNSTNLLRRLPLFICLCRV